MEDKRITMFLEIILIAILIFAAINLSIQFFQIALGGYAPIISTKNKVIKRIMKEISPKDGCAVYELGCGNAGFLKAMENKFPNIKKLTGIEYFFLPYLIGKIQTSLRKSKIKIIKKNCLRLNMGEADIIYCFLSKPMMAKLKEKFKKECKAGTQIISYQFRLPDLKPKKIVDLKNNEKKKIYFYTI